jgi:Ca-activated chloride channel family protein
MVRFTHPEMLYLFLPLLFILIWYSYKGYKIRKNLEGLGSPSIKKFLLNRLKFSKIRFRSKLIVLGIIFILLGSAGPQVGVKLTELKREGVDILILMDTSASMDAIDVKPSRIEKAKHELGKLLNQLKGNRAGIIAFAGSAHLHCPLTQDFSAVRLFLNMIKTDLIANQGTDLAGAMRLALENIKQEEEKYKLLIIVSDGEDHQGEALSLSELAKDRGIIIHTLGVGTPAGGPIPIYNDEGQRIDFKKNKSGSIVTTILNEVILDQIARTANGRYIRIENQVNAIAPLLKEIKQMEKKEIKSHSFSEYEDRYQIFLLIGLLLFIIEFIISTRTRKEIQWEGRFTHG